MLKCILIDTLTTSCLFRFVGDTPGDYTDLKLSNPDISVEDGTLSINNIQKTNEGYYLCEAVNGIGAGLSAVIFISVQGNLYIYIYIYMSSFLSHSFLYSVDIICTLSLLQLRLILRSN